MSSYHERMSRLDPESREYKKGEMAVRIRLAYAHGRDDMQKACAELALAADAEIAERNKLLSEVLAHLTELAAAWQTGAISERDGLGGRRSNRNWDLAKRLAAIDAAKGVGDE